MFNSTFTKKARKTHRCSWCNFLIEINESFYRVAAIYEGDFWSGKFHVECLDAFNKTCKGEFYQGGQTRGGDWGNLE